MALTFNTAENAFAITPSDVTDISATSLYIGGAGNLAVLTAGADTVTFNGVLAGTILPVEVTRVLSTGTTATNIIGLY